jgi:hypothetical protein
MRKYIYLLAAVVAITLVVVMVPTGGAGTPFTFTTITPAQLATDGITLSNPEFPSPLNAVSSNTAAATASQAVSGGTVYETHYVHCLNTDANPQLNEDCWVSSVSTGNLPAFPDPNTGQRAVYGWAIVVMSPQGDLQWVNAGK